MNTNETQAPAGRETDAAVARAMGKKKMANPPEMSDGVRECLKKIKRRSDERIPLGDATDEQLLGEINRRRNRCYFVPDRSKP